MQKIKSLLLISTTVLLIILTNFFIKKTSSFFSISTEGETINLKMSEWVPASSEAFFIKEGIHYLIEEKIESQNSSNLQQVFNIEENQYLSFQYKINSSETGFGFDDPNFLVKINGVVAYKDQSENNIWKRGFINLANYPSDDGIYEVDFLSNNTFDDLNIPLLEIKEISTSKFLAKENDLLKFSVSKPNAKIYLKYLIEENGIVIEKKHILTSIYEFLITEHFYDNQIEYYSIDYFGNKEASKFISIHTDFNPPNIIDDLEIFPEGDSELSITFTSPEDNFSNVLSAYETRMGNDASLLIDSWFDLQRLSPANFKYNEISFSPSKSGASENILFKNVNLGATFVAMRSIDQAGNYSEISNIEEIVIQ
jgi:hypothetical protein